MCHKQVWPHLAGICGRGRSCCAAPVVPTVSGNHGIPAHGAGRNGNFVHPLPGAERIPCDQLRPLHQIPTERHLKNPPVCLLAGIFPSSSPHHTPIVTLLQRSGDRTLCHLLWQLLSYNSEWHRSPFITSQLPAVTVLISCQNPVFLVAPTPAPPN